MISVLIVITCRYLLFENMCEIFVSLRIKRCEKILLDQLRNICQIYRYTRIFYNRIREIELNQWSFVKLNQVFQEYISDINDRLLFLSNEVYILVANLIVRLCVIQCDFNRNLYKICYKSLIIGIQLKAFSRDLIKNSKFAKDMIN